MLSLWKWLDLINAGGFAYKLNSLAYFLTSKGKVLLYNRHIFYRNSRDTIPLKNKRYKLEREKTGTDININKNLKLFDFIRHGQKKKN